MRKTETLKDLYSAEDKEAALALLKGPDIIDKFLASCHKGYIGRENELLLVKLATISRRLLRGMSVIITGPSSVGKSALMNKVLETVWPTDYEDFTAITPKYLQRRTEPLDHKIIVFKEMHGSDDAAYILRTILSEGNITHGTVTKNITGSFTTETLKKSTEGLVVLTTNASRKIDWELNTRVFVIELSHDEHLARQVYRNKAAQKAHSSSKTDEPSNIQFNQYVLTNGSLAHQNTDIPSTSLWRVADHLLESLPVLIPFAQEIAEVFPVDEERHHRDFDKVLVLIEASALLHQYQRERDEEGRIIATKEDYELVYSLKDLISQTGTGTPAHIIRFLKKVEELEAQNGKAPTREEVQLDLGVSKATIKRYISKAAINKFISVTGKGQTQYISIIEIPQDVSPLPEPDTIFPAQR